MGDAKVNAEVDRYKELVNKEYLSTLGLKFDDSVVRLPFDLIKGDGEETPLSNVLTDAMRWYVNQKGTPVEMSLESEGFIRDSLRAGVQQVSDIFRYAGMGEGIVESTLGEPMVRVFLSGEDLRQCAEVSATLAAIKGSHYYVNLSGFRATYHALRLPFDKVFSVERELANGSFEKLSGNGKLYPVTISHYLSNKFYLASKHSYGLLKVLAKDEKGNVIKDHRSALIDIDPNQPGVQEAKEWIAVLEYLSSMPKGPDGIPTLISKYKSPEGRLRVVQSLAPAIYVSNAAWMTWLVPAIVMFLLLGMGRIVLVLSRKFKS